MQILGPGRVDGIEELGEIGALDLQAFGFDIAALEEAVAMLLNKADETGKSEIRSNFLGKNRLVPRSRISFSQPQQCFIGSMIGLHQHQERVHVVDCAPHDLAHFSLSDMGILPFPVARGTGLPGMDVFDWSIAKSHRYQSLGLSGQSGQSSGAGIDFFIATIVEPELASSPRRRMLQLWV